MAYFLKNLCTLLSVQVKVAWVMTLLISSTFTPSLTPLACTLLLTRGKLQNGTKRGMLQWPIAAPQKAVLPCACRLTYSTTPIPTHSITTTPTAVPTGTPSGTATTIPTGIRGILRAHLHLHCLVLLEQH